MNEEEDQERKLIIEIIHILSLFLIFAFIWFAYKFGYYEGIKETNEIYQKELQSSIYKQEIK